MALPTTAGGPLEPWIAANYATPTAAPASTALCTWWDKAAGKWIFVTQVDMAAAIGAGGGGGSVASVSVVTANGVSGTVADPTTTPAITLTLGAITPTTVNGLTLSTSSGTVTIANSKTLTVSNTVTFTATDGSTLAIGAGGTLKSAAYTLSTDYQPIDATLTALAANNWVANALPIGTGADTVSQVTFAANTFPARSSSGNLVAKPLTDFMFTLLDDADAATARTTLGVGTGTGDALKADPLSQFAATSSAQLAGVLTDETGTGLVVFNTAPFLTGPVTVTGTVAASSYLIGATTFASGSEAFGNTFVGWFTGQGVTTGSANFAGGYHTLESCITGSNNMGLGAFALQSATSDNNCGVGYGSLSGTTTGSGNTGVGQSAGGSNTTGSSNTFIGSASNPGAVNLTNATAIGANAVVASSNTVQLGDGSVSLVNTSGQVVAVGGFVGNLTGNASTATALQTARTIGGVSFDGTTNIVPATITVADTSDSTCWVGLFESATGDLAPKTDGGMTYNATTGMLTATGFTGPLTGNSTTATTWATGRTLSITGDLAYTSPSFSGSGNVTAAGTLANSGVSAGSYTSANITVDAKGRVTAASNGGSSPTTGLFVLSSTSVNATVTGFTSLLTASANTVVTAIVVRTTSVSGFSAGCTLSVGTNSATYNNVLAATGIGLSVQDTVVVLTPASGAIVVPTSAVLFANVSVGATASTYTVTVEVLGYTI